MRNTLLLKVIFVIAVFSFVSYLYIQTCAQRNIFLEFPAFDTPVISVEYDSFFNDNFLNDFIEIAAYRFPHGGPGIAQGIIGSTAGEEMYKVIVKQKRWQNEFTAFLLDRVLDIYKVPFSFPKYGTIEDSKLADCEGRCVWTGIGSQHLRNEKNVSFIVMQYLPDLYSLQISNYSNCFTESKVFVEGPQFMYSPVIDFSTGTFSKPTERDCFLEAALELSDLNIFDYLTANGDRWRENFLFNAFSSKHYNDELIFLDNGNSFSNSHQVDLRFCTFRKSTINKLRKYKDDQFLLGEDIEKLAEEFELKDIDREAISSNANFISKRLKNIFVHVNHCLRDNNPSDVFK